MAAPPMAGPSALPVINRDGQTLTVLIDPDFFSRHPQIGASPALWQGLLRSYCPGGFSSVRLFCTRPSSGRRSDVVAAQFDVRDYDAVSGTQLLQSHLAEWIEDINGTTAASRRPPLTGAYDKRAGKAALPLDSADPLGKSQMIAIGQQQQYAVKGVYAAPQAGHPTLFTLVQRLAEPEVTTPEQRQQIRLILSDFLANEIPHSKVYSYIGQVIGFHALNEIIQSITAEAGSDLRLPPPSSSSAASAVGRTISSFQAAEGASQGPIISDAVVNSTGVGFTPAVGKVGAKERSAAQKLLHQLSKHARWIFPTNCQIPSVTTGHQAVLMDTKAFICGGASRPSSRGASDQPIATFETMTAVDLWALTSKTIKVDSGASPPSLMNHTAHLVSLATGPTLVVFGGMGADETLMRAAFSKKYDAASTERSKLPLYVEDEERLSDPNVSEEQHNFSDEVVRLTNRLLAFDFPEKCWLPLDERPSVRPCPRHSHSSAVVPATTELIASPSAMFAEYLIIYGGVGPNEGLRDESSNEPTIGAPSTTFPNVTKSYRASELTVLGDMWSFNFVKGSWSRIEIPTMSMPAPRYGASLSWLSDETLLLFGGEGRGRGGCGVVACDASVGTPGGDRREILSDCWMVDCKIIPAASSGTTQPPLNSEDIAESSPTETLSQRTAPTDSSSATELQVTTSSHPCHGPPRAHHAAVALTARWSEAKRRGGQGVKAVWGDENGGDWTYRQRVVVFVSGTSKTADGVIYETPSIVLMTATPCSEKSSSTSQTFALSWRCFDDVPPVSTFFGRPFAGRRGHTAFYFDALGQKLLSQERQTRRSSRLKVSAVAGSIDGSTACCPVGKGTDGDDTAAAAAHPFITAASGLNKAKHADGEVASDDDASADDEDDEEDARGPLHDWDYSPCIFVMGGFSDNNDGRQVNGCRSGADSKGCHRKHHLLSDVWILKLSKISPSVETCVPLTDYLMMRSHIVYGQDVSGPRLALTSRASIADRTDHSGTATDDGDDEDADMRDEVAELFVTAEEQLSRKARRYLWDQPPNAPLPTTSVESGSTVVVDDRVLRSAWSDPTAGFKPVILQRGAAVGSGLLWGLATLVKRPFSPFSYLLNNAVKPGVAARIFAVSFEKYTSDSRSESNAARRKIDIDLSALDTPPEMIVVSDTGSGFHHETLHALIKSFGAQPDSLVENSPDCFGLGFKLAAARLSHSCLVLTATVTTFGAALFCPRLVRWFGGTHFGGPVCFWSRRSGEPIALPLEHAEFQQMTRILLEYSMLKTLRRLQREFAKFGTATGTRFLFYELRRDLSYPLYQRHLRGRVSHTSHHAKPLVDRLRPESTIVSSNGSDRQKSPLEDSSINLFEGYRWPYKLLPDVHHTSQQTTDIDLESSDTAMTQRPLVTIGTPPSVGRGDVKLTDSAGTSVKAETVEVGKSDNSPVAPQNPTSTAPDNRDASQTIDLEGRESPLRQTSPAKASTAAQYSGTTLHDIFPLWKNHFRSPDFDLSTYMFWSHLHLSATLHLNGTPLLPTSLALSKTANCQPFQRSLKSTTIAGGGVETSAVSDVDENSPNSHFDNNPKSVEASITTPDEDMLPSLKGKLELPLVDDFANSSYRFLQRRLYHAVEMPYLIKPEYGESGFYGIVGFLNDPLDASLQDGDRVCETGILLYHRGQLINRMFVAMPATPDLFTACPKDAALDKGCNLSDSFIISGAINLPDFLVPRATKEEFLHDGDLGMYDLYDKIERDVLQVYLKSYSNPSKLHAFQQSFIDKFNAHRESLWRERKKRFQQLQQQTSARVTSPTRGGSASHHHNHHHHILAPSILSSGRDGIKSSGGKGKSETESASGVGSAPDAVGRRRSPPPRRGEAPKRSVAKPGGKDEGGRRGNAAKRRKIDVDDDDDDKAEDEEDDEDEDEENDDNGEGDDEDEEDDDEIISLNRSPGDANDDSVTTATTRSSAAASNAAGSTRGQGRRTRSAIRGGLMQTATTTVPGRQRLTRQGVAAAAAESLRAAQAKGKEEGGTTSNTDDRPSQTTNRRNNGEVSDIANSSKGRSVSASSEGVLPSDSEGGMATAIISAAADREGLVPLPLPSEEVRRDGDLALINNNSSRSEDDGGRPDDVSMTTDNKKAGNDEGKRGEEIEP